MKCLQTKQDNRVSIKQYIVLLLKALIWPFSFIVFGYLIIILFSGSYFFNQYNDLVNNNKELSTSAIDKLYSQALESPILKNNLANYLEDNGLLIILITVIIFMPIFIKIHSKYKQKTEKLKIISIIKIIILGMSVAILLNLIIFNLNKLIEFTNRYNQKEIVWFTILSIGIIGPILEEYLFRGILYNKLKEFNNQKKSMILTGIIFALIHLEFSQIIYAFILNFLMIFIYEKFKTIKAPIILHISLNLSTLLLLSSLIQLNILASILVIFICCSFILLLWPKINNN